jgi:hypothetical protein
VLGVVAGADGLAEAGGAVGLQAGEEDCGFDLCGGDGGVEVDGVSGPPWMVMGAWPSIEVDLCAHLRERLADALHGAEGEGVVADEGEGVRVRGDEAGEHAHGRAGVAAVERGCGLLEFACGAGDFDDGPCLCRFTTVAPRASMQAREEWGSAPVEKFERRVVPSARPASIA